MSTSTAEAAPARSGGPIADGMYFLTATTIHGLVGEALTFPATQISVSSDVWQEVIGYETVRHTTSKMTTSGNTFTLERTCPVLGKGPNTSGSYTATATSITLYTEAAGPSIIARVYTKQ
jgi:hypothetical protein